MAPRLVISALLGIACIAVSHCGKHHLRTALQKRVVPTEKPQICGDNAPNCYDFNLDDICHNPDYAEWVYEKCRQSCGLCDLTPGLETTTTTTPFLTTVTEHCRDKVENCDEYQDDMCTNPDYLGWAHENCRDFCGFCEVTTKAPPLMTTAATTTRDPTETCFDSLDNCDNYDIRTSCCGAYEPWARENCARHCKFCTPAVTPTPLCHDVDPQCADYGDDLCTNPLYDNFVRENCAGTCKICDQPEYIPTCAQGSTVTATVEATTGVLTTSAPGVCEDLIDCAGYDIMTSCCSPYEAWARKHCPKHCKFCVPAVPDIPICHDIDPLCSHYGADLCTNPDYDRFIHEHCAGTCKVCERPEVFPPCANATLPTAGTGQCYMDGNYYPQESSWDTSDCNQHCRCVNGLTNDIHCDPIVCPSPVPNCDLVHIPGHCCPLLHNCKPHVGGFQMVG
ncbi:zonadhesin-like [Haliotis cracherodii]|uniref:zonadhesin-like n=1 Tax=Haliotis cracherodii TaxID=6455 RepID=UPI0039EC2E09